MCIGKKRPSSSSVSLKPIRWYPEISFSRNSSIPRFKSARTRGFVALLLKFYLLDFRVMHGPLHYILTFNTAVHHQCYANIYIQAGAPVQSFFSGLQLILMPLLVLKVVVHFPILLGLSHYYWSSSNRFPCDTWSLTFTWSKARSHSLPRRQYGAGC